MKYAAHDISIKWKRVEEKPRLVHANSKGRPQKTFNIVKWSQKISDAAGLKEIHKSPGSSSGRKDWELKSSDCMQVELDRYTGKILDNQLTLRPKFTQDETIKNYKSQNCSEIIAVGAKLYNRGSWWSSKRKIGKVDRFAYLLSREYQNRPGTDWANDTMD